MTKNIINRDLKYIWHPCSQMKDYKAFPPLIIKSAEGSHIKLNNGSKIIDATSSWWCKNLGHGHPRLKVALLKQADKFEHVIFAGTTNEVIIELSEKLARMTKTLKKSFYASDGSSAVEAAIKMSLHSRVIEKEYHRTQIMALGNSYHGETGLALSATDINLYRKPYNKTLIPFLFLKNIPYVSSKSDPIWHDCSKHWPRILSQLNANKDNLSAIIIEPIVQGAGGMLIYSKDFLSRLRTWTKENQIHLIADEIMTGFGRTGMPFAFQHADIEPDIMCLAKGLTSGWLPMSAVLTTNEIYNKFYDDFSKGKTFLHSHTHSGNVLAAAVALETMKILEEDDIYNQVNKTEALLYDLMQDVSKKTCRLQNIRNIGAIVAADLILNKKQKGQRYGYKIFQNSIKFGVFMRPLGNTIYWMPPLNTKEKTLLQLKEATIKTINSVFKSWNCSKSLLKHTHEPVV
ncbi:MAG: adenosylmethionine--8-amino-7-oxononanoate transaminase [Gammaproteobacteria bacterium]|nr:adenosylmethionine--8-amino-7-oxononanoate transaminase [Gammaproteobacteria bacterium]